LKLQNNSAFGVGVNFEANSFLCFKLLKNLVIFNLSHDIFGKYINSYSRFNLGTS